ncbi:MAG: DUF1893 domain-containing protein [Firmicutes bacterium]|nr:DUF1893 domain-containing protein [Bacillota bacterium]
MTNAVSDPLKKAVDELLAGDASCVGYAGDGEPAFKSRENGVKPLMDRISGNPDGLRGLYVADKVIGKAAACVLVRNGVAACHGLVMSEPAARVLAENGVPFSYGQMTPFIRDRAGTGVCPMERAVEAASTAEEGYETILRFLSGRSAGGDVAPQT